MKVEVLLAMMFFEKEQDSFLEKLNLQTDIIIGNQCNDVENRTFEFNGNKVTVLSRNERGVGKNRNACLFYSDADIVIFADNDVSYYDGYADKIKDYYIKNPDADLVIFNFKEKRGEKPLRDINLKNKKATLRDITQFGTWAITAKREKILRERISFSLLFGGGAKYSMGEDSLFLHDCYKRGLKIYLSNITLGEVIHRESTWYKGLTQKYIEDKGVLFKAMSPKLYKVLIVYHVLKHKKYYAQFGKPNKIIKLMKESARNYEKGSQ